MLRVPYNGSAARRNEHENIFTNPARARNIPRAKDKQDWEDLKGSAGDPLAQQGVDDHVAIALPADHIVSTESAESGLDS